MSRRHRCCPGCSEAKGTPVPLWPADSSNTGIRPPRGLEDRYQLTQKGWCEALGISSAIAES